MADIFLSYNEKDREAVRRLAETLPSAGWSVWWDRRIPAGLTWRAVLERELKHMRCMVVLWSQHSVASEWVCEEAAEGRQLGRLVPVLIEHVRPPAGFREIQAADLVDWDGSQNFLGLRQLVEDIEGLIGKPGAAAPAALEPPHENEAPVTAPRAFPWPMSALFVVIAVGVWAYYGTVGRKPIDPKNGSILAPLEAAAPASAAEGATAIVQKETPVAPKPPVPASAPASTGATTIRAAAASDAKPAAGSSSTGSRYAALRERLQLGESLSSKSQVFFNQECSQ